MREEPPSDDNSGELQRSPPREQHMPDRESLWDRVADVSTIAPIHGDPTLDPADNPWEVAMMAGWGDPDGGNRGHDAMQGAGEMLLGEADAMEGLSVASEGEAGPLELTPEETLREEPNEVGGFSGPGYRDNQDWCRFL